MSAQAVILFDGVCNFCNNIVKFVIKRDKKAYFKFASLQSEVGQQKLDTAGLPKKDMRSLVLVEHNKVYRKSSAALRIAKHLSGGWKIAYLLIGIPKFLRDPIYNFVAKNRYKWFGKRGTCMMPTASMKNRFLDA